MDFRYFWSGNATVCELFKIKISDTVSSPKYKAVRCRSIWKVKDKPFGVSCQLTQTSGFFLVEYTFFTWKKSDYSEKLLRDPSLKKVLYQPLGQLGQIPVSHWLFGLVDHYKSFFTNPCSLCTGPALSCLPVIRGAHGSMLPVCSWTGLTGQSMSFKIPD